MTRVCIYLVSALALGVAGCSKQDAGSSGAKEQAKAPDVALAAPTNLGSISVQAPAAWQASQPSSSMRKAQWAIGSGDQAAELAVFHFGTSGAGSLQANLDRWYSQFEQPDGKTPSRDVAQVENKTIAGMQVTQVQVSGRYVAETRPGSGERVDKANHAMLAAIIEAADGAYYLKMVGPEATVKDARAGFEAMLASVAKL